MWFDPGYYQACKINILVILNVGLKTETDHVLSYLTSIIFVQNVWVFSGIGLSYVAGSALLGSSIWEYYASGWVPRRTRSQLTAAAGLGLSCALLAFLLTWIHGRRGTGCKDRSSHDHTPNQLYKPVDNSSSSGVSDVSSKTFSSTHPFVKTVSLR